MPLYVFTKDKIGVIKMGLTQFVLDILFNKLWNLKPYNPTGKERGIPQEQVYASYFTDADYEAGFGWLSIRITKYMAGGDQYWNLRIGTGDYAE